MPENLAASPQGLLFEPTFLDNEEERGLVTQIEHLEFQEIVIHGVAARRTARHFGLNYHYEQRVHVDRAEPLPTWLEPVRARCADLGGVAPDQLVEALVQRYPPGAT